jgi:hypothetical protein
MIMKSEHSGNEFLLTSQTWQGIIESNGAADQTAQVTIRPQSLLVCSTGSVVSDEAQSTAHRWQASEQHCQNAGAAESVDRIC